MYQVIILNDSVRDKNYYQSYFESEDKSLGNISVEELPPYQDINKARACYWDAKKKAWIFDEDKYTEIVEQKKEEKEAAEQAAIIASTTPSNAELAEVVMELAGLISTAFEKIEELGGK